MEGLPRVSLLVVTYLCVPLEGLGVLGFGYTVLKFGGILPPDKEGLLFLPVPIGVSTLLWPCLLLLLSRTLPGKLIWCTLLSVELCSFIVSSFSLKLRVKDWKKLDKCGMKRFQLGDLLPGNQPFQVSERKTNQAWNIMKEDLIIPIRNLNGVLLVPNLL